MEYRWQTQDNLYSCLSCHWWLRCGPGRRREQEESGKPCPDWRRLDCCEGWK